MTTEFYTLYKEKIITLFVVKVGHRKKIYKF